MKERGNTNMKTSLNSLYDILTYKRPAGSASEKAVIRKYIDSVPGITCDKFGNRMLVVGPPNPSTAISCHTDTVHTHNGRQRIQTDRHGVISLADTPVKGIGLRECLGADDGAGVYTALRMIEYGVPALYMFHRGEEVGGIGSSAIADHTPWVLDGIERCIAFDRRGTTDIITHQMMGRCCSDVFAWALADAIGMSHEPCAFGTFTDTANYTELVPECTNVAIGYSLEHTSRESLDTEYLEALVAKLCRVDFDSLPTVNIPGDDDYSWLREDTETAISYEGR